jgi:hypothetical protein
VPELVRLSIGATAGADAIGSTDVKEAGTAVGADARRDDRLVVAAAVGADARRDDRLVVAAAVGAEARRDGRVFVAAAAGAEARRDERVVPADIGAEARTDGSDAGLGVKPLSEMDAMSLLI